MHKQKYKNWKRHQSAISSIKNLYDWRWPFVAKVIYFSLHRSMHNRSGVDYPKSITRTWLRKKCRNPFQPLLAKSTRLAPHPERLAARRAKQNTKLKWVCVLQTTALKLNGKQKFIFDIHIHFTRYIENLFKWMRWM